MNISFCYVLIYKLVFMQKLTETIHKCFTTSYLLLMMLVTFFINEKVMITKQKVVVLRRIDIHVDKVYLNPHICYIYIYDGRNDKLKLVYIL